MPEAKEEDIANAIGLIFRRVDQARVEDTTLAVLPVMNFLTHFDPALILGHILTRFRW
jgi:hypothetical protein